MAETIAERLRKLREQLNLSQREFAEKIGRTLRGYQGYEYGISTPDNTTLLLISKTFGVNFQWLKEGKGEMFDSIVETKPLDDKILEEIVESIKKIEGKVPKYIQNAINSRESTKILEALASFLHDLSEELDKEKTVVKGNVNLSGTVGKQEYIEKK